MAAEPLSEVERLRELLVELVEAKAAYDETDAAAMHAAYNDAPDASERLDAMEAASLRLDDAFEAAAKGLGEENVGSSGEVVS